MEAMREAWTDERLDDLTERMEKDFRRVDERFEEVITRMDRGFEQIDAHFDQVNARMDTQLNQINTRMDREFHLAHTRFDSLQQSLIVVSGGLIGTLFVAMAAFVATQL
jgi:hypothetical protein